MDEARTSWLDYWLLEAKYEEDQVFVRLFEACRGPDSNLGEGPERPLLGSRCTLYFD